MTPKTSLKAPTPVRRLTLDLPTGLTHDLIRLAELRDRDFATELAEDFAFLLRLSNGLHPGTMLEHLFEVERLNEPRGRVSITLPRRLYDTLGSIARSYGTTRSLALTAIMHRGVRGLLAAETASLEKDLTFTEAYIARLTA
jgi:hypothetical protein